MIAAPPLLDCLNVGRALLPLDDAIALLQDRLTPVCRRQTCSLEEADGRILADDITARVTVPPHDNAAVDGYAMAAASLREGTALPIIRRIAAGDPPGTAIPPETAVRIFTGAPMPPGADTVAMQEDCAVERGGAPFDLLTSAPRTLAVGANRRRAGEDVSAGSIVLHRGRRLRGMDLAMAAASGHSSLPVHAPLRVALFSTGDELRPPGSPLEPGQIYDSNRFGIGSVLRAFGCQVSDLGVLPDHGPRIHSALQDAAAAHHLVVTSGGVSVGEEDHVTKAIETLGTLYFWRLAMKPGRPLAVGQLNDAVFLGLPGNPVSSLVSLLIPGRVLVHRLQGRTVTPPPRYRLPAAFSFQKKAGRREFIRVWRETDAHGIPTVHRFAAQDSGILSSMVRADGLVDIATPTTSIAAGDSVDYLPFAETLW